MKIFTLVIVALMLLPLASFADDEVQGPPTPPPDDPEDFIGPPSPPRHPEIDMPIDTLKYGGTDLFWWLRKREFPTILPLGPYIPAPQY